MALCLAWLLGGVCCPRAWALIEGGEGNAPIANPRWPAGAAVIFNDPARAAYWVGPPFGGGQWHAECRGDAVQLNEVLANFARLDVANKRVIVHDGVGQSFWLNMNREKEKEKAARIDWTFMVWEGDRWKELSKLPADLNPTSPGDLEKGPPAQLDVYAGGSVRWSEVAIPKGLEVVDNRLEAHGYSLADGVVLEGETVDLATGKPIMARMQLQRVEPRPEGGYRYPVVAETSAEMVGAWALKNAPAGWARVVVSAEGYVPRVVGHLQLDDQPGWSFYRCGLSKAAQVSGRIIDEKKKPLAEVRVSLANVLAKDGVYDSPAEFEAVTDAAGIFRLDNAPLASASVWVHKPGYCRPGLGEKITTPAEGLELTMLHAAQVLVTIDFQDAARPEGYLVHIEPEGGEAVGKWSGSGNLDAKNQMAFKDVPPGRYVIHGRPNPSSGDDRTKELTVDLIGGKTNEYTLTAKP